MERHGEEIHVTDEEARSGSTGNVVRYVLLISLALVIVALSAIWITGSLSSNTQTGGFADTERAANAEQNGTGAQ